ncbi:MAG: hypothetical protein K8R90_07175 [Candidatus Cloacimonetes bacterium]|nr:hypothetical protein [Candidatus Cloacimonadota bacterium]
MKLIRIILALFLTIFILSACGDSSGSGTAKPPDPYSGQFDFIVAIQEFSMFNRENILVIGIMPGDYTNPITTLELTIDGQDIDVNESYDMWVGGYEGLVHGQTHSVTAIINGASYSEDITVAYWPTSNISDYWNMSQPLDIEWTIDGDNMWQEIAGYAEWWDYNDDLVEKEKHLSLSPSDRNATIPAYWLDIPMDIYPETRLGIYESNWAINNRFLVMSIANDIQDSYCGLSEADRHDITHRNVNRVLDLISR